MRVISVGWVFMVLVACGGSGGSSAPGASDQQVGASDVPVYQRAVFEPSGLYKDSCQSPRTGINPETDAPFADRQGLLVHENFWLRSWSDETYLWYDEIPDQNPANFSSPLTYFEELKTSRTTDSGEPLDRFHFAVPTDEHFARLSLGQTFSYGAEYILTRSSPPRELQLAFVEPGSPADLAGWQRGDFIVTIDGEDLENGDEPSILNAGLFPDEDDRTHTFVVQKLATGERVETTLTAANITESAVLKEQVFTEGADNIGVMVFNHHLATAERELAETMQRFANQQVNELVVDLRYNGGGFLAIAAQLAYMIAGPDTGGLVFERLVFNDKLVDRHPDTGKSIAPTLFFNETLGFSLEEGQALPSLNLDKVYVITSENTCSASESLINGLRGIDIDVIQIGGRTCGKPYGFFPKDNCGITYSTIQIGGVNNKGFGDFGDGFNPSNSAINIGVPVEGCVVPDDLSHALLDVREARLAEVFFYRENGRCSEVSSSAGKLKLSAGEFEERLLRPEWQRNKHYQF